MESPEARGDGRDLLLKHLPLLDRVVDGEGRRHRLSPEDLEDFRSWVYLKVLETDGAVFRSYRGDAPIASFVRLAVRNLLLDFRNLSLGRWRPSSKALRLGPDAVRLERLMHRDGVSRSEAIEIALAFSFRSRDELWQIVEGLPQRAPKRVVVPFEREPSGAALVAAAIDEDPPTRRAIQRIRRQLAKAMGTLSRADRRLVELIYLRGYSIARVARELGEAQRPLYSRRDRCLKSLRRNLQSCGVEWGAIRHWIGRDVA